MDLLIEKQINLILDRIVLVMILLTFSGTLLSANLNGQVIGGIVLLVLIIAYLVFWFRQHPKLITKVTWSELGHRLNSKWCLAVLTGVYQIILIYGLAAKTGFDTGIVRWAAESQSIEPGSYLANYFSNYPNNLVFLFIERAIYNVSQFFDLTNYIVVLAIVNLVLVDFAIILVGLILKRYFQRRINWTLLPLIYLISPWIVIVYTDTIILPLIAGSLYLIMLLKDNWAISGHLIRLIIQAGSLGILLWAAYNLKPSAIILVIAFAIELGLVAFFKTKIFNWKKMGITLLTIGGCFGIAQFATQKALQQQTFIPVESNVAQLPSHYIMMGMNKESRGGYSQTDFEYSSQFRTAKTQQKANISSIKQRLRQFGFIGYGAFLIEKNYLNTSDGTLGWLKEGQFFENSNFKHHEFIRTFFYQYGSRLRYYQTFAQLAWIAVIAGVLFSFFDHSFLARSLRLAFLGLLLFLLIFEGGRSRYLIQFLPIIYTLAVIGWTQIPVFWQSFKTKVIH